MACIFIQATCAHTDNSAQSKNLCVHIMGRGAFRGKVMGQHTGRAASACLVTLRHTCWLKCSQCLSVLQLSKINIHDLQLTEHTLLWKRPGPSQISPSRKYVHKIHTTDTPWAFRVNVTYQKVEQSQFFIKQQLCWVLRKLEIYLSTYLLNTSDYL